VAKGRSEFLTQFPGIATPQVRRRLAVPHDPRTFERCKLDHGEREAHAWATALHRDLLRLRREDPVFRGQKPRGLDGSVLSGDAFVLRFFGEDGDDRLLLINMGRDLHLDILPEPLLAPPSGRRWRLAWSSEDLVYGGGGAPELETGAGWSLPGHAALVLAPSVATGAPRG
jgi:maltooligosyltrehalose trehalohydrolase